MDEEEQMKALQNMRDLPSEMQTATDLFRPFLGIADRVDQR